ncbi:MAG: TauD/TfdA family dioxygenase [Vicinamibacterales bacterium]
MTDPKPSLTQFGVPRRKPVVQIPHDWMRISRLGDEPGPVVVEPAGGGMDLVELAALDRDAVTTLVAANGAVLFRGFPVGTAADLDRFIRAVSGEPLEYRERSSPRRAVTDRIYTSTEYSADQRIFFHNESSYAHAWPLKIFFLCLEPAETGGETPLADCRRVLARIPPPIRRRFEELGVQYIRNFGTGLGLNWQDVFQTSDRHALEEQCRASGYEVEWRDERRLRTRRVAPAVARHPESGELVWFNHAAFFHSSMLPEAVRDALIREFDERDLPHATFYGDGTPIEPGTVAALRDAYCGEVVSFRWQRHDLLMVDNMRFAHGREPFTGARRVVVGMSEIHGHDEKGRG